MLLNILFLVAPLILGLVLGFVFENAQVAVSVPIIVYMIMGLRLYQIRLRQERLGKATEILHYHGRGEELMRWLEDADVYSPEKNDGLEYRVCQVNLRALTGFRGVFPYDISEESLAILVNSMCHLDENAVSKTAQQLLDLYPTKKRLDKFFDCMAAMGRHDKTTSHLQEKTTELFTYFKDQAERHQQDIILKKAFGKKGYRNQESRNQF